MTISVLPLTASTEIAKAIAQKPLQKATQNSVW